MISSISLSHNDSSRHFYFSNHNSLKLSDSRDRRATLFLSRTHTHKRGCSCLAHWNCETSFAKLFLLPQSLNYPRWYLSARRKVNRVDGCCDCLAYPNDGLSRSHSEDCIHRLALVFIMQTRLIFVAAAADCCCCCCFHRIVSMTLVSFSRDLALLDGLCLCSISLPQLPSGTRCCLGSRTELCWGTITTSLGCCC